MPELADKIMLYATVCLCSLPWIVVIIIGIRGGKVTIEFGRKKKEESNGTNN